jgi:hypothetical protein
MPSRTKEMNAAIAAMLAALPKIPKELLDQFVTCPMTARRSTPPPWRSRKCYRDHFTRAAA